MSLEFPLDNRPTHRFLDLLIVIRDLDPRDRVLEILMPIGTESRVKCRAGAMNSTNVPTDPVENKSKAVLVWI